MSKSQESFLPYVRGLYGVRKAVSSADAVKSSDEGEKFNDYNYIRRSCAAIIPDLSTSYL